MSPDFYNAIHLTPLGWTAEGRSIDPARIIQTNQRKWDYRQPVIQPDCFSPRMLAMAVKLSEALFDCRPSWLRRALSDGATTKGQILRDAIPRMMRVHLLEWWDLFRTWLCFQDRSCKIPTGWLCSCRGWSRGHQRPFHAGSRTLEIDRIMGMHLSGRKNSGRPPRKGGSRPCNQETGSVRGADLPVGNDRESQA